jgi:hypothetical protein
MRCKRTIQGLLIGAQLVWAGWAGAAVYPQPPNVSAFTTTGFIEAATLNNPTDVLSGGTVTVNGTTIVVPRNMVVVMSATNLTWQELWALAPCPWGLGHATASPGTNGVCAGNGRSGLALTDSPKPLTTYEITILGNRVVGLDGSSDSYVAGLVFLGQQSLNLGQGFINFIDYVTGELFVGGTAGTRSGVRVQINDPKGRYGRVMSPDPRFTADTDNPTIRAKTGYPMCIPRAVPPAPIVAGQPLPSGYKETDAECPQRNRPLDPNSSTTPKTPLGNFTLGPAGTAVFPNTPPFVAGTVNAVAMAVQTGDSTKQAPFMTGDYVEYAGTLQQDSQGQYISAWQIVGNVGAYTSPDSVPAYLSLELTILGVGGTPITSLVPVPAEFTTRIKMRGFFTDPTRAVDLFAVMVDPCTGAETESLMLGSITTQKGGIPWGRFRDVDQAGIFPITRQWRGRYTPIFTDPGFGTTPPPDMIAANGLEVMQYTIPVSTFITPENTNYGDPTLLVMPQNFQDFPFLAKGEGPWRGGPILGPLDPFPFNLNSASAMGLSFGLLTLSPFQCTGAVPPVVVFFPANQTVSQGKPVTLDASHSTGTAPLTYGWVQTSGPQVTLDSTTAAIVHFTAPPVTANTGLTFRVTVTDGNVPALSSTARTLVVVAPGVVFGDTVTILNATYKTSRGVLNVSATSSDTTCAAVLRLLAPGSNLDPNATMVAGNPVAGAACSYTYVSPKEIFPAPTSVTVISSEGGSATTTVIRVK